MSKDMDFTCPEALSPGSNHEEAPLLEDKSGAKGDDAGGGGGGEDELLMSENVQSDCLESQRVAKLSASKPAVVAGVGLENLGNTCFLNSVMQCFIHTVPLLHGILSDKHSNCNKERFCIICALRELINLSLARKLGPVAPTSLVDNMSYFSSGFQRFQQEDAHEFLQCFLDRLESCHNSSPGDNIVKQVFGGCIVSRLKCCNCGHCSDTYEPAIDLSLEIEETDNLLTSLQSFTKVENIEDPEIKFTCEECKEQVSIQKQLSFDKTPSVAVFQLKRFKNDGCLVHKIDKHVAFPLELDLLPFTVSAKESNMELKYKLYAVVVHDGWTSTSGHYYCFICLSPNVWCKFDDSRVELVSEEHVLSQEAYLLFYAKEGTSNFSSFIETQPYFNAVPPTWKTSPKSVLDRINTSPVNNSTPENKLSRDCNNKASNDDRKILTPPLCNVPSPKPNKDNSPTSPEKVNYTEKVIPWRSPSPEIYREDPPDAGFSIPRMVERIGCKRRLEKDMNDMETRQAYSCFKKTSFKGSRAQQYMACIRGSKTEPAASRKKVRRSVVNGSSTSPVIRQLVPGNRR